MGRGTMLAAWMIILGLSVASPAAARTAGRLDPSFAGKGWTETPPGTGGEGEVELLTTESGASVVGDPIEGKIVRLRPSGSLDRGFGRGGQLSLGPSTASEGHGARNFTGRSVAVDATGRVLVFGEESDPSRSVEAPFSPGLPSSFAVVLRFHPDGRRDPSFGEGKGFIRSSFGLTSPLSSEIPLVGSMAGAVDSQGRPVLIAGVSAPTGGCSEKAGIGEVPAAVVRLTTSGRPDPGFGSDGVSPIEGPTRFTELLLDDADGLAAGVSPIVSTAPQCREEGAIYRLGPNGERVAAFGSDGVLSLEDMSLVALEPAGGMIVARRRGLNLDLSRLSPQGTLDPNFGRDGVASIGLPRRAGVEISSVLVDGDGRILLAGYFGSARSRHQSAGFVVDRVLADGRLDPSFGDHGRTITVFHGPLNVISAQAKLDPQGRLVEAGETATPGDPDGGFIVARYLTRP